MKNIILLLGFILLNTVVSWAHCPSIKLENKKLSNGTYYYKVVFQWNGADPFRLRFFASCSTWCQKISGEKFSAPKDSVEGVTDCLLLSVSSTLGSTQECLDGVKLCESILPLNNSKITAFSLGSFVQIQWEKLSGKGIEKSYRSDKDWVIIPGTEKPSGSKRYQEIGGVVYLREVGTTGPIVRVRVRPGESIVYCDELGRILGKATSFDLLPRRKIILIRKVETGELVKFFQF